MDASPRGILQDQIKVGLQRIRADQTTAVIGAIYDELTPEAQAMVWDEIGTLMQKCTTLGGKSAWELYFKVRRWQFEREIR